jgi:hypothetical protein
MSIIYCEKHSVRWDSDKFDACTMCELGEDLTRSFDNLMDDEAPPLSSETKDERLIRRINHLLDEIFIYIGENGRHDYRLHPYWVKDMAGVRDWLIKAFKETT